MDELEVVGALACVLALALWTTHVVLAGGSFLFCGLLWIAALALVAEVIRGRRSGR